MPIRRCFCGLVLIATVRHVSIETLQKGVLTQCRQENILVMSAIGPKRTICVSVRAIMVTYHSNGVAIRAGRTREVDSRINRIARSTPGLVCPGTRDG